MLRLMPTAAVSRFAGRLARVRVPRIVRGPLWRWVAGRMDVDLAEAARPANTLATFDEYFTRRLRPGARPVAGGPNQLVAPADGRLTRLDATPMHASVQVKRRDQDLSLWLGRSDLSWKRPMCAVIYLSPKNYHRVHAPIAGRVRGVTYVPGGLQPVNPRLARRASDALGRNERVTTWLDSERGEVAVVMVGALCVGAISLSFCSVQTNRAWMRRSERRDFGVGGPTLEAGEELGTFHMGSTVLLVFEGKEFETNGALGVGDSVRMGQSLGRWPV